MPGVAAPVGLWLPQAGIIRPVPKPPTYVKLDMAFGLGAGSTLFDKSRYRNHGAITGADWVAGLHGYALSFNGSSDKVEVPHSASLNLSGQKLSLEALFYPDVGDTELTLIVKGATANWTHKYALTYGATENKARFVVSAALLRHLDSDSTYSPLNWIHVVGTYDGESMRIYVNGEADGSRGQTADIVTVNESLWLGVLKAGRWFDGKQEIARVLEYVMSASEVKARYNALV